MNYEELYAELQIIEKELKEKVNASQKLFKAIGVETEKGNLKEGTQFHYQLTISPAEAAKTAIVSVQMSNPYVVELVNIGKANEAGVITLTFQTVHELETTIDIFVEGTDIVKQFVVNDWNSIMTSTQDITQPTNPTTTPSPTGEDIGENSGEGTANEEEKEFPIAMVGAGAGVFVVLVAIIGIIIGKKKKKQG